MSQQTNPPTVWMLESGSVLVIGPYAVTLVFGGVFVHGASARAEAERLRTFADAIEKAAEKALTKSNQRLTGDGEP